MPGASHSKHIILPFLGYQTLDGEKIGYNYSVLSYDFFTDTLVTVELEGSEVRNVTVPVLGLAYRYIPSNLFYTEFSLAAIHDGENIKYLVRYDQSGFTTRSTISVTRRNTIVAGLDLVLTPKLVSDWLKTNFRVGGGYAWRKITSRPSRVTETISITDAEDMFVIRGGIDLALWRNNNFLIESAFFYSSYIPTDGDNDTFGGFGWKVSVFPAWSMTK